MARFSKAELDIVALAKAIEIGLAANSVVYPEPPRFCSTFYRRPKICTGHL